MFRKVLFFYIAVFLIITVCYSQKSDTDSENVVLSQNVEYDVKIRNDILINDYNYEWWWYKENLEASSRLPFLELLFKNALSGKLVISDTLNNVIDITSLKSLLILNRDSNALKSLNLPEYTKDDSYFYETIQSHDITAIRFRENWWYNPKTLEITKQVVAIAPVVFIEQTDEYGELISTERRLLFWIVFPEKNVASKVLTKRFESTAIYKGRLAKENSNIDSASLSLYMNKLLLKYLHDSITGYDPRFSRDGIFNWPLSIEDFNYSFYYSDRINFKERKYPFDEYDSVINKLLEINSIRFLEEWNFNPATMYIEKKVSGICTVSAVYHDHDDMEFIGFKPYFWVYFGDVWMPFDEKLELKNPKY